MIQWPRKPGEEFLMADGVYKMKMTAIQHCEAMGHEIRKYVDNRKCLDCTRKKNRTRYRLSMGLDPNYQGRHDRHPRKGETK